MEVLESLICVFDLLGEFGDCTCLFDALYFYVGDYE